MRSEFDYASIMQELVESVPERLYSVISGRFIALEGGVKYLQQEVLRLKEENGELKKELENCYSKIES